MSISELITAINIALGNVGVADCTAADRNDDGAVGINEITLAVHAALHGCGGTL